MAAAATGPVRSVRGGRGAPRVDGEEDDERVSTTLEDLKPVPVELGGVRGGPDVRTLRRDRWWRSPAATVAFLTVVVVYATWAVFQNAHYYVGAAAHRDLISPLYSPCLTGSCVPGAHGRAASSRWWHDLARRCWPSPFRAGSGLTCYYYRKAYYRGFWQSPPACGGGRRPRPLHGRDALPAHPPEPAPLLLRPGPGLQRHPHHRRRHGLPPARRRRHRRERGHARARGQRRVAVAVLGVVPRLSPPVRRAASTSSPSTPSATGCGSSPRRSTPGTCRSPGPAWPWWRLADLYVRLVASGVFTDPKIF